MTESIKQIIILTLFLLLILTQRWRIIIILSAIFLVSKILETNQDTDYIELKMRDMVKVVGTDYYLKRYLFLKTIQAEYSPKDVNIQKLKIINQMLYNIPITDDVAEEWLKIRRSLIV